MDIRIQLRYYFWILFSIIILIMQYKYVNTNLFPLSHSSTKSQVAEKQF